MRNIFWVSMTLMFLSIQSLNCSSPETQDVHSDQTENELLFDEVSSETLFIQPGKHLIGTEKSKIIPKPGKPALVIHTEKESLTIIENISIETSSTAAVIITGNGKVSLKDVNIHFLSGYGILAENLELLQISNTTIDAPAFSADSIPLGELNPKNYPIVAIVAKNIEELDFEKISFSSTLYFALIIENSKGTLSDIHIDNCLKIGVNIQTSEISIYDSTITNIKRGLSFFEPYGLLVGGSTITSQNLQISNIEGHGLVQIKSVSTHEQLSVFNNSETGIWIDNRGKHFSEHSSFILKNSEIHDNHGSGVIIHGSENVIIEDTDILRTFELPSIVQNKKIEFADGIQLIESFKNISLSRIHLTDNKRVGIIVDPLSSLEDLSQMSVSDIKIDCSLTDCPIGLAIQNVRTKPDWQIDSTLSSSFDKKLPIFEAKQFIGESNILPNSNLVGASGVIDIEGEINELGLIGVNGI